MKWAMNVGTQVALLVSLMGLTGCAPHISRPELARRIEQGEPPPIVDVRSDAEYAESHVPGAIHISFYSMLFRTDELPKQEGEPVVLYCEHGPRAGIARAALWLTRAGDVRFLDGHMKAWKADNLPVESAEPTND